MFILWLVVGVIVGALAAYANVALRFAQLHRGSRKRIFRGLSAPTTRPVI